MKKLWTEAKEKSRTKLRESSFTQGEGDYTTAQDTATVLTDTSYSAISQNAHHGQLDLNGFERLENNLRFEVPYRALEATKSQLHHLL